MGNEMQKQEDEAFRQVFEEIDKDKNGVITAEEMAKWCKGTSSELKKEVGDGLNFEEFKHKLRMAVHRRQHRWSDIDQDGDGYVTPEDLIRFYGPSFEHKVAKIMRRCDTDKDGKLSFVEFAKLRTKQIMHTLK